MRNAYLGLAEGLMSNKEVYRDSFNFHLGKIHQLMAEMDTFAIRQGDTWEYRYALSSMLRIFNTMPSMSKDHYCESRSLSPLSEYVDGRSGSTSRPDLRRLVRL